MMHIRNLLLLLLFNHRTLAFARWDVHFMWIRFLNMVSARKGGLDRLIKNAESPVFLNLGSGPRGLNDSHWVNVDGYMDTNVHYCMDFTRQFPFSNNCFDGIFCEHVFEHFTQEEGLTFLKECFRILKPGGVIRIIVPDGEKIIRTYIDEPETLLSHRDTESSCAMEAVNSYFRQRYEHHCLYDFELIKYQMELAGGGQVSRESYRQGKGFEEMLIDDKKYEWESLYVEAVKPGNK